ncbi:MAG: hypothetical protein JWM90_2920 [Thermoleophilia bacterium]|nr:hypothetical protein [Thermoleophilia bacterium]
MIGLVGEQLLALAGIVALLMLPGWIIGRLLQLQLALPAVLLPAAWFACGLGLWTVPVVAGLTFGWSWAVTLAVHAGATMLLGIWLLLRQRARGHAKSSGVDPVSRWTIAGIALCTLLALGLRTRLAFDTLFHIGLVRRLVELPHPTFESVDRIAGAGVNPAYVVPTWQAALAAVSGMTGLDPATVIESMAGFVVFVAASAAAGFGRLLGGRAAAEVAAVAGYAWLRVWYPRREAEGDGIGFAVHPGNVALDVLLPLLLAATLVVALRAPGSIGRRAAAVIAGVATILFVVLHANYSVYLGIIGIGLVGWLLVAGPWTADVRRRVFGAIGAVALPGLLTLAALLPVLAMLDHFGETVEQRIDYHLLGSGAWQVIRPGHFYDAFGAAGLIALLLLPLAVLQLRGIRRALLGGATLAFLLIGLVPPLLDLLGSAGSLTVGLRMPRPFGVLLIGVIAVALPWLVDLLRAEADSAEPTNRWRRWLTYAVPLALVFALAATYGYPLTRQDPPEYGWDWPTLVATAGLLAALVIAARGRRSSAELGDAPELEPAPLPVAPKHVPHARSAATTTGLAVLLVTLCLAPSGVISLRRATWQSREVVASVRADELACLAAVQSALRDLPAGSVLAADPMTAYLAQALGPVRTVGDFKTWNGSTDSERAQLRIDRLEEIFDSRDPAEAAEALDRLRQADDVRYVLVADGEVEAPIGSDMPDFDARGLRQSLTSGLVPATRIADGLGRVGDDADSQERGECTVALWQLEAPR